jgi:hypothetical protein
MQRVKILEVTGNIAKKKRNSVGNFAKIFPNDILCSVELASHAFNSASLTLCNNVTQYNISKYNCQVYY